MSTTWHNNRKWKYTNVKQNNWSHFYLFDLPFASENLTDLTTLIWHFPWLASLRCLRASFVLLVKLTKCTRIQRFHNNTRFTRLHFSEVLDDTTTDYEPNFSDLHGWQWFYLVTPRGRTTIYIVSYFKYVRVLRTENSVSLFYWSASILSFLDPRDSVLNIHMNNECES